MRVRVAELMERYSQYGVGVASGVEHVATAARLWHEVGGTLVLLDSENAFNTICRVAIARGLERFCPELLPLFQALYCGALPPELRMELRRADGAAADEVRIIKSHLGCQQGDPLGPLWFAVGATHLLHPGGLPPAVLPAAAAAAPAAPGAPPAGGGGGDAMDVVDDPPPPPHCAYLDDNGLHLPPGFSQAHFDAVCLVKRRLAAGGLRVRADKSLAVAQHGSTFSEEDRERLAQLNIPFIDDTTPPHQRGFVIVGVPVGSPRYVAAALRDHLFAPHLWRLAWQLIGMARSDFQAAFRIFRWSLCKRMGFLARNVDPPVGVSAYGAYDGFCLWVLERLQHLRGTATAEAMRAHLAGCVDVSDAVGAAFGGPLVLPQLHAAPAAWTEPLPEALAELAAARPALPLRVAQMSPHNGGLGLPHLRTTAPCAFVAQLATTLHKQALRVVAGMPAPVVPDDRPPTPPADAAAAAHAEGGTLPPLLLALRSSARHLWRAYSAPLDADGTVVPPAAGAAPAPAPPPAPLRRVLSPPTLAWVAGDTVSRTLALAAVTAAAPPLPDHNQPREGEQPVPPPPQPPHAGAPPGGGDDVDDLASGASRRPQHYLSTHLHRLQWRLLLYDLRLLPGVEGKPLLAQLRSQSGPGALSWLDVPPGTALTMTPVAAVTMTLVALFVEPWRVSGGTCPFNCSTEARPSCVHVFGCRSQPRRGKVATHEAHKRCLQGLLRSCGAPWFLNEDCGESDFDGDRADTVVLPGALALCGDAGVARKGVVLDNRVCAPTVAKVLRLVRANAAHISGFAASEAEKEKLVRYAGHWDATRYVFVPFVQECFGRLGEAARTFIAQLATHSAARAGGSEAVVRRRRAIERRRIVVTLSATLAREEAERVLAYVRDAQLSGRTVDPVSMLLARAR